MTIIVGAGAQPPNRLDPAPLDQIRYAVPRNEQPVKIMKQRRGGRIIEPVVIPPTG
jgi:hypothetical protein